MAKRLCRHKCWVCNLAASLAVVIVSCPREISIPSAEQYARTLHDQGHVIASFEARRELIRHKLQERSQALQTTLAAGDALLDKSPL